MRTKIYVVIFVFPAVALFSGCASLGAGGEKSTSARGYPVMVVERGESSTFYGAAVNGRTNYVYVVRDGKGRESMVMSKRDDLVPGNCATLWRDISSPYYPRLSRATENCAPLSEEPDGRGGYMYINNKIDKRGVRKYPIHPYSIYYLSLDNWLDVSEEDTIRVLGEPDKREERDGKTFLTYARQITLDVNGNKSWIDSASNNWFSKTTGLNKCFTTFEFYDSLIFGYFTKEEGGGCY